MMPRERDAIERTRKATYERLHHDAIEALRAQLAGAPPVRALGEALSADDLGLIVEPKRATALRGTINADLDMEKIARECEHGGAVAMSIVTEPLLSQGMVADLAAARGSCELPLIARDFIVHAGQVIELRIAGADAVMLPAGAFEDDDLETLQQLGTIVSTAHSLGMDAILSVRTSEDLELALECDPDAIVIDNRDDAGRIDVERTFDLLSEVPVGNAVISESIGGADEVARLHRAGVDALLLDEGHVDTDLPNALAVLRDLSLDGD